MAPAGDPTDFVEDASALLAGVGGHALLSYLGMAAASLGTIVASALIIQRVGALGFGAYALVLAVAAFAGPAEAALGLTVTRMTAHSPNDASNAELRAGFRAFAYLGTGGILATCVAVLAAWSGLLSISGHSDRDVALLIAFCGLAVSIRMATGGVEATALGFRRFTVLAVEQIIAATLTTTCLWLLLPAGGLPGVGLSVVAGATAGRAYVSVAMWAAVVRRRASARSTSRDMRSLLSSAAPLILLGIGSQVVTGTDLFVLGATASVAVVGRYRLASGIPTQIAAIVYRGYDTVFPTLAGSGDERAQETATAFLSRILCYVVGLGLSFAMLQRAEIIQMLIGRPDDFAQDVLSIFCLVWMANATVHGLAIVLVARGHQAVFTPLVMIEATVNLVLTVLTVRAFGPRWAAWSTLITLAVSNLVLLPLVVRKHLLSSPWQLIGRAGVVPMLCGGTVATVATLGTSRVAVPSGWLLPVQALSVAATAALVGGIVLSANDRRMLRSLVRRAAAQSIAPPG